MSSENGKKAVMVIGGGIAGIQASLDLANMGLKVHLVEKSPSIGGRMAQLDKTFPTNDCAMCILAPKMIEASTHSNIQLHTYSQVERVSGKDGTFQVEIREKATFVDWSKCTGCGVCEQTCPVILPKEFDEGLGKRKAIYIPYAQAVPKKYTIDKTEPRLCKAACKDACPVHTNVLGYLKLISEGQFLDAYKLIRETNPLPAVCGRVCYAPCEENCNRGQLDDSLAVRELKRFASDQVDIEKLEVPEITKNGKKVAVIGSGPAGLAAANDLALKGYTVTIYEAQAEAGGMLRYGIPEYRLPKDVLRREIGYIQKLGVVIKTSVQVGKDITLQDIKKENEAIFIAPGAQNGLKLGVPGEDLPGVTDGIRFLRAIGSGEKVALGKRVAVIGGGNTAMDCARTARRMGAGQVTIVYRRTRNEMPAAKEEVKATEQEGVTIEFLATPVRFLAEKGKLAKMECQKMQLGEPDASGRRRPVPIKGSEYTVNVDTVIAALGQAADLEFIKGMGITLTKSGGLKIDAGTGKTDVEGIFAGGDAVTGPAFVIDAIAAGKKAAASIDRYLKGEPLVPAAESKPEKLSDEEIKLLKKRLPEKKRLHAKERPGAERIKDSLESGTGYAPEEATEEASRCLAGQIKGCIECHECELKCEAKAIDYAAKDKTVSVTVGAIILATGLDLYDVSPLTEYGYGRIQNVITALEFERLTAASGPTFGELRRKTDGKIPQTIAFIQCVGSRDFNYKPYCSSVCCMHAAKEAILASEHHPGTKSTIFFMDIRAVGKRFQEYILKARKEYGVEYVRARPGKVEVNAQNQNPVICYEDTITGERKRMEVELVVLCQAMVPSGGTGELAKAMGIQLDEYGFVRIPEKLTHPVDSSRAGILACGYVHSPRDIPDSVVQGSAAAARAAEIISQGEKNG
jgi:heterodisulfide reductase subunit A-like polyferredoxin